MRVLGGHLHDGRIADLKFSPAGTSLATMEDYQNQVRTWDLSKESIGVLWHLCPTPGEG